MMMLTQVNYLAVIALMMIGLYVVIAHGNLFKKIIGLTILQTSVFILFISVAAVTDGNAPILAANIESYANPLPHVLVLTAIVVGVATIAVALALIVRIAERYGTIEEESIQDSERREW